MGQNSLLLWVLARKNEHPPDAPCEVQPHTPPQVAETTGAGDGPGLTTSPSGQVWGPTGSGIVLLILSLLAVSVTPTS